ncbi:uncharacterized protein LACBIDRAFT_310289 [Laccaria bicolor S238N-H82]|uniref:Predicted protein n=1 Tax=Laccaria bicolor (strain S238N-H82 / ATCC MYA-4686) TaxID=486041 RepID=B0DU24_LACBS|nr:uncharacterized protein LACBIDRAFT_310289 [Laccaria bicolor S238N-H82]EDR01829.1 predicted protein [Laccaria bicolor S238N-H82]|eukprot:XP_001887439.1 predicted protein [Laccaria bicolor S238N-H82]
MRSWQRCHPREEGMMHTGLVVRLLERHNVFLRLTTPLSGAERAWKYSLFWSLRDMGVSQIDLTLDGSDVGEGGGMYRVFRRRVIIRHVEHGFGSESPSFLRLPCAISHLRSTVDSWCTNPTRVLSTPLSSILSRVQRSSKKAVEPNPERNVESSHSRPLSARRGGDCAERAWAAYTYGGVTSFASLAMDIDLALSDVHPRQSSPLKSHRSCTYAVSEVYPIIDVGQTGQSGKEGETLSVTTEEGDVHECIVDGYSS